MKRKFKAGIALIMLVALVAVNAISVYAYGVSLLPQSEDDLELYVPKPVESGEVTAELDENGYLVLTNSGGSYPNIDYNSVEEFDASKKVFLDYDFTIEGGTGQIALKNGDIFEWKLGNTISTGDLAANTYTGTLELTDEKNKATGLISDGYLLVDFLDIFCIGDGCKITIRKLDIYEEGSKPGEKPTVDPNAPTVEPTTAAPETETPTETVAPSTSKPTATKAAASATATPGETENNGIDTWIIVVIVVVAVAVAGGLVYYFTVAKKKNK